MVSYFELMTKRQVKKIYSHTLLITTPTIGIHSGMSNRFVPKFIIGFKRFNNEFSNAICKWFKGNSRLSDHFSAYFCHSAFA
jgi:hypothetical protein